MSRFIVVHSTDPEIGNAKHYVSVWRHIYDVHVTGGQKILLHGVRNVAINMYLLSCARLARRCFHT